jgi:hypothetical protein
MHGDCIAELSVRYVKVGGASTVTGPPSAPGSPWPVRPMDADSHLS